MTHDRFVLVHYDKIARDPRFNLVRDNDKLLGLWQRLLWLADAMWPSPAPIPGWANKTSLAFLASPECGLVELLPCHMFKIHGLDAERQRRIAKGKPGAAKRWGDANEDATPQQDASPIAHANADAIAHANALPNVLPKASPIAVGSRAREIERGDRDRESPTPSARTKPLAPERARPTGWDEAVAYLAGRHVYVAESSANGHVEHLSRLIEQHGWAATLTQFEMIAPKCHELRQFVLGADNALNPVPVTASKGTRPTRDLAPDTDWDKGTFGLPATSDKDDWA